MITNKRCYIAPNVLQEATALLEYPFVASGEGEDPSLTVITIDQDITQPLSGSIEETYFASKYYAGIDYSGGTGGPYADSYLARVNGTAEGNGNDGTFTFTIFCCPFSFSNMYVQVCGGEGYSAQTTTTFITEYPLTKNGVPISFAAQKKHALDIVLPTY